MATSYDSFTIKLSQTVKLESLHCFPNRLETVDIYEDEEDKILKQLQHPLHEETALTNESVDGATNLKIQASYNKVLEPVYESIDLLINPAIEAVTQESGTSLNRHGLTF